jgi:hypothetical protein
MQNYHREKKINNKNSLITMGSVDRRGQQNTLVGLAN